MSRCTVLTDVTDLPAIGKFLILDSYVFHPICLVFQNSIQNPDMILELELIYYFTYFPTVVPSNSCVFLSCRTFVVNTTFSTGLVGIEVSSVSWLGLLTVGV